MLIVCAFILCLIDEPGWAAFMLFLYWLTR